MGALAQTGSIRIMAMPLRKGCIGLTSGAITITDHNMILCKSDGDITLTWVDDTTTTVPMLEMESRTLLGDVKTITIVSGSFDLA